MALASNSIDHITIDLSINTEHDDDGPVVDGEHSPHEVYQALLDLINRHKQVRKEMLR